MEGLNKICCGCRVLTPHKKVSICAEISTYSSHLALNKCADATLVVPNDFDVLDLGVLRKMFHEHPAEISLVNVGWQAATTSFTSFNRIGIEEREQTCQQKRLHREVVCPLSVRD